MATYGIALLSLIPMRGEPREQSEMVSQLLFGESYEVIGEDRGFIEIIGSYDQYRGWIDIAMHHEITGNYYNELKREMQPVQSSLMMSIERKGNAPFQILAGSTLPGYNKKKDRLEIDSEIYYVRWTFGKFNLNGFDSILKTASLFLFSPYLWGGRSSFGCDCSGFVQILYKIHGIQINRDANQQAIQGSEVSSLSAARTGDLAFFGDPEGKIYHVGMVIEQNEIIHSSGFVHIDRLDEKGIFSLQRQKYSHTLHSIRRYIE